jgi:hypothetical protein
MTTIEERTEYLNNPFRTKALYGDYSPFYITIAICTVLCAFLFILNIICGCCSKYKYYWQDKHTGKSFYLIVMQPRIFEYHEKYQIRKSLACIVLDCVSASTATLGFDGIEGRITFSDTGKSYHKNHGSVFHFSFSNCRSFHDNFTISIIKRRWSRSRQKI